jgi:tetratricopeptide (TPR) repeat protein
VNPLFDDRIRRMIPRWRAVSTTALLGELASLKKGTQRFSADALNAKVKDWQSEPSIFVASDIVGTALILNEREHPVVREAATAILDASDSTQLLRSAAEHVIDPAESSSSLFPGLTTRLDLHLSIASIRARLHDDPRNAMGWVDISHCYTLLGQTAKAEEAIRIALKLAPNNRHVLRSATRLYVHAGRREEALWMLRHASSTQHDPWLAAAEIGVAGLLDQSPKFAKVGASLVSADLDPRHISEVAAALGTLESEHGNRRKAKKLFQRSLEDPNENVLAQAAWAARATNSIDVDPLNVNVPFSYEARARINFRQKLFTEALREAQAWFNDQRFSVSAATFASYTAAVVLARHEEAIKILEEALVPNPDDWTLINNYAFSLASLDRLQEAEEKFSLLSPEVENPSRHGVWLATGGLLAFRAGNAEEGQRLYDQAIATFDKHGLPAPGAVAAIFKAREALRVNSQTAADAVRMASERAKREQSPEFDVLIERLISPLPGQLDLLPEQTR